MSPAIAGSWRRCMLDYSLDPARHYAPTSSMPRSQGAPDQHEDLLQIASAEIDWLYEYIAESGYALILTDASGIVLYEKTDPTLQTYFARRDCGSARTGASAARVPTASARASPKACR